MKIGIESNINRDKNFSFTNKIVEYLIERHVEVVKFYLNDFDKYNDLVEDLDYVIVVGGDGTILNFIQHIEHKDIKILGINNGHLGYLADVESSQAFIAIDSLINDKFTIETRIMLECVLGNRRKLALNELYINKAHTTKMLEMNVEINGSKLEVFRGDGIIVTTPTGSTAYNLSAGGAILKPDGNMIGITPICPHMLHNRPVIVDGDDCIKLKVEISEYKQAIAYIDGEIFGEIDKDKTIKITKAKEVVRLVKTQNKNFYNVLKDKMLSRV